MTDFLGTGPSFPLFVQGRDAGRPLFGLSSGGDKVHQSIELILSTAPGERLMRPDFGCGIHDLLFEPISPGLEAMLSERVSSALVRWEPRIDVLKVDVGRGKAEQEVLLDITYRLRANNAVYNMVYPFFLQEGIA